LERRIGAVPAGGSDDPQLTKRNPGEKAFLPRLSSQAPCQIALAHVQTLRWLADSEPAKTGRNELQRWAVSAYPGTWNFRRARTLTPRTRTLEDIMGFGKGALLWLLGIPLPIIILLALFWR
jgi:hypothetical protein